MQKGKRWEVSLLNRGKGRGFWANVPPLSFLPTVEQGRGAARRRRPDSGALGLGGGRDRGAKEEGGVGARSPAAARPEAARGGLATGAGGGGRGGAAAVLGGGQGEGER